MTIQYKVSWKSYILDESQREMIFDDVQWKEYGAKCFNDTTKAHFVIPYTSIYEVELLFTDDGKYD